MKIAIIGAGNVGGALARRFSGAGHEVPVAPRPQDQVVDLAYRADGRPTALVDAARAAGCHTVDGLEILVRQGAASFELWTGVAAPVDVMRAAVARIV